MAKKKGIAGWHSMRKDQLVQALLRLARKKAKAKVAKNGAVKGNHSAKVNNKTSALTRREGTAKKLTNGKKTSAQNTSPVAKRRPSRITRQIQQANALRVRHKDLAGENGNGKATNGAAKKDRAVLMVRDPYWLHVHWEISRSSIERMRAAMAEQWHGAKPTLRLFELDRNGTTNTAEKVARDIPIHGGVNNWYVDVHDPPKTYRAAIGYLGSNGKFRALVRSNAVSTPSPGSCDAIDENWTDVAQNYEKIFALSGGYEEDGSCGDLQELFEERLRRPMGSPLVTRYGVGAQGLNNRGHEFEFEVEAETIIYGTTRPNAHVTLGGEPVQLREDGSFTVRLKMPDKRQVIPVVAASCDGVEQRTVVLAIERNTKVMEPKIRDPNE